jgi:hypothetical protein
MTVVGFWNPTDPKEAKPKLVYLLEKNGTCKISYGEKRDMQDFRRKSCMAGSRQGLLPGAPTDPYVRN